MPCVRDPQTKSAKSFDGNALQTADPYSQEEVYSIVLRPPSTWQTIQTDKQTDGQTDRQTDRHERQIDKQICVLSKKRDVTIATTDYHE
jgi:hypothetical protein